jgi:hypothetical protein
MAHDPPDHIHRNRDFWNRKAADYVDKGRANWARPEPDWGIWDVRESALCILPAVGGLDPPVARQRLRTRGPDRGEAARRLHNALPVRHPGVGAALAVRGGLEGAQALTSLRASPPPITPRGRDLRQVRRLEGDGQEKGSPAATDSVMKVFAGYGASGQLNGTTNRTGRLAAARRVRAAAQRDSQRVAPDAGVDAGAEVGMVRFSIHPAIARVVRRMERSCRNRSRE